MNDKIVNDEPVQFMQFKGRRYELASRHGKNVMIRREVLDWQKNGYRTKIVQKKNEQLLYISGD
jgi:hypothetical protein